MIFKRNKPKVGQRVHKFAWLPKKMPNGKWVWLEKYWKRKKRPPYGRRLTN